MKGKPPHLSKLLKHDHLYIKTFLDTEHIEEREIKPRAFLLSFFSIGFEMKTKQKQKQNK